MCGANSHGRRYTASFAFFEALWEAGVTHCFVNLGSDHPSAHRPSSTAPAGCSY